MTRVVALAALAIVAQNTMTNLVLTEADTGASHDVKRGETVELRLKENPTTGYRWSIDLEPPEAARIAGSRFLPAGTGAGASGSREFTITVNELGAVRLEAKLWREWQGEGSVIQRQSFALKVH